MLLGDILVALLFALLFAGLFGALFGAREGVPSFLFVVVLLFFFAWAGALYLGPLGPALFGVYWLPGLVVTLLIFLLLAAFAQARPPRSTREAKAEIEARQEAQTAFGVLFWVLIGALLVAILVAYLI